MGLIALLPMKGHSERVPNKNLRAFCDRPLYHCVAQILQGCILVDKILINTDSEQIAEDARAHFPKVEIVERPLALHGDQVPMNDIIAYDLSRTDAEYFIQTHSTNPLLTETTLLDGIQAYLDGLDRFDSLFSVTRLQTRLYWESGSAINHNPAQLLRTQDLPPVFEENSNFYVFSKASFTAAGNKRIGLRPRLFPISKMEAIDIDEPDDFELAQILYETRRRKA